MTKKIEKKAPLCHTTHPPFLIERGVVYGGSCLVVPPGVRKADILIGFDIGMALTERRFPWAAGQEIYLPIENNGVPTSPRDFQALVLWTLMRLAKGARVYAGCIGGHGRTGMFLAALTAKAALSDTPIAHVRATYCKRAVESAEQIAFLRRHFGAEAAEPQTLALVKPAWKGTTLDLVTEGCMQPWPWKKS